MAFKQIRPDYNLNGSGKRNLYEAKAAEVESLRQAIETLSMHFPHGRDYQCAGFYIEDARKEQQNRIDTLKEILVLCEKELEEAAE